MLNGSRHDCRNRRWTSSKPSSSGADAPLLRGSRDFPDLAAYCAVVDEAVGRHDSRIAPRIALEREALQNLPARRTTDHEEAVVTVTSSR